MDAAVFARCLPSAVGVDLAASEQAEDLLANVGLEIPVQYSPPTVEPSGFLEFYDVQRPEKALPIREGAAFPRFKVKHIVWPPPPYVQLKITWAPHTGCAPAVLPHRWNASRCYRSPQRDARNCAGDRVTRPKAAGGTVTALGPGELAGHWQWRDALLRHPDGRAIGGERRLAAP